MLNEELVSTFFDKVIQGWKDDAAAKNQKIPTNFSKQVDEFSGQLYGSSHFKYLVFGRGPGTPPPVDSILEWLKKAGLENRDKKTGKFIKYQSLAYMIAMSIGKHGTAIFQGKKPGIDFLGPMEANMPALLKAIAHNEAINIQTALHNSIK